MNRRSQRGMSLIELMIGLAIALFLMAGVATVLQSVRQFFGSQSQLAQLQDNERLAMNLLTGVIQSAGYFPDPTSNTAAAAFPVVAPFAQEQVLTGTTGATAPGDTITVRYMTTSGDGVINCTGGTNASGANVSYVNVFSIDNQGQLVCALNGAGAVPLVSGLQNLQVMYGVKTDLSVDNRSVDSYLKASEVTAGNYWSNVISVRVTLAFTNPLANEAGQPATIPFTRVIGIMGKTGVKT